MSALLDRRILSETNWVAHIVGTVVLVSALIAATFASAQRFQTIEPKISTRQAKAMRGPVGKALRDPAAFEANKKTLDDYFSNYYFPNMTLESQLGELSKNRENLFKQYLRVARVPAAQKLLTDKTLFFMRGISRGKFHPAVRYNAVLILGMLDEKVANGIGVKPVPLPAGAKELLELLEQDEFKSVKVPASIKLAALIGLQRHVRFGIDPQYADRLTKASLALIAQEEPPADLAPEIHHWIKCQAAKVLSRQFAAGPNAEVQAAFTGMIADPHMSLEDRCCVADLMKLMEYDAVAGLDVTATLGAMGDLLKAVASDESEKADHIQQASLEDFPVRGNAFGDQSLSYQRRRLIARLHAISEGGRSLSKGLPDAERQQLQSLLATLTSVMEVADDKDSGDVEITTEVIEMASQVLSVVESWKPAKEEPAKEATEELEELDLES